MTMLVLAGILLVFMIVMNVMGKRANQKRADEHQKMLDEQLVPGAWVHTRVGFFGRFVDIDGDVLILETEDGVETYWDKRMLASVGDLPLQHEDDNDVEIDSDVTAQDDARAIGAGSDESDYHIEGELTVEDVLDAGDKTGGADPKKDGSDS